MKGWRENLIASQKSKITSACVPGTWNPGGKPSNSLSVLWISAGRQWRRWIKSWTWSYSVVTGKFSSSVQKVLMRPLVNNHPEAIGVTQGLRQSVFHTNNFAPGSTKLLNLSIWHFMHSRLLLLLRKNSFRKVMLLSLPQSSSRTVCLERYWPELLTVCTGWLTLFSPWTWTLQPTLNNI